MNMDNIGGEVFENTEQDIESRSEWDSMHAKWIDLYFQQDNPKNPPWEGSSDESIPLLTEGCNQFQARAYQAFFPNNNIIKAVPTGTADQESIERADRVGKHMSWQLMVQDQDYKSNKDALLLSVPLHGCAFTKTYYDPILRRNRVENVRATDLILPYGYGPVPLDELERKTHVIWMSLNKAKILRSGGYFEDIPEVWNGGAQSEVDAAVDRAEGIEEPLQSGMCKIYEQHTLLDLNGDGIAEPVIVTICAQSKRLLKLEERSRGPGKLPVHYFTQYNFLPNPDGTYGLGLGHLVGKINSAVNKMTRQTIDAGTLENTKSGFISDALDIKGGEVDFSMGKFTKINASNGRVGDHIHEMRFSGPSAAIVQAITLLLQRGDRLQTVTEALTGQTDKVLQPTAMLALIEQGLQVYSSVFDRLITSWTKELRKIYDLNAEHLDLKEYFSVQDATGMANYEVYKADYGPDLQISPLADPKMSTEQQKMARAEAEYGFAVQNPMVMNDPQSFYNASKRYLTTMGAQNIDEILPKPEQKEPEREDDPNTENFYALMPVPNVPGVHADQDHKEHLAVHDQLLSDETWSQQLTKEGKEALEKHAQMHKAFVYAEMTGVLNGIEGDTGGPEAGGGFVEEVPGVEVEALPVDGGLMQIEGAAGSA